LREASGVGSFDPIDASDLPTDFLGHAYYASSGSMLSDIYCLLKGIPPEGRPLLARVDTWWHFKTPEARAQASASVCLPAIVGGRHGFQQWWTLGFVSLGLLTLLLIVVARRRRQLHGQRDLGQAAGAGHHRKSV
jgi:hypothetical protein